MNDMTTSIDPIQGVADDLYRTLVAKGAHNISHAMVRDGVILALQGRNLETLREEAGLATSGYIIDGLYTDNRQRYSQDFGGENQTEAQVLALVDRDADHGLTIIITAVRDALTGKIVDEEDVELLGMRSVFERLARLAAPLVDDGPKRGDERFDAYVSLCTEAFGLSADQSPWEEYNEVSRREEGERVNVVGEFEFTASQAIRAVTEAIREQPGFAKLELEDRVAVYQAQAILDHYEDKMDSYLCGLQLQETPPRPSP